MGTPGAGINALWRSRTLPNHLCRMSRKSSPVSALEMKTRPSLPVPGRVFANSSVALTGRHRLDKQIAQHCLHCSRLQAWPTEHPLYLGLSAVARGLLYFWKDSSQPEPERRFRWHIGRRTLTADSSRDLRCAEPNCLYCRKRQTTGQQLGRFRRQGGRERAAGPLPLFPHSEAA